MKKTNFLQPYQDESDIQTADQPNYSGGDQSNNADSLNSSIIEQLLSVDDVIAMAPPAVVESNRPSNPTNTSATTAAVPIAAASATASQAAAAKANNNNSGSFAGALGATLSSFISGSSASSSASSRQSQQQQQAASAAVPPRTLSAPAMNAAQKKPSVSRSSPAAVDDDVEDWVVTPSIVNSTKQNQFKMVDKLTHVNEAVRLQGCNELKYVHVF